MGSAQFDDAAFEGIISLSNPFPARNVFARLPTLKCCCAELRIFWFFSIGCRGQHGQSTCPNAKPLFDVELRSTRNRHDGKQTFAGGKRDEFR